MIIIISGAQGVGKTTVINELLLRLPKFTLAISATTRTKRINEHHHEYEFLSKQDFLKKELEGYFMEVVKFNNNQYGTPKHQFKENVIFNVTASSIENFLKFIGNKPHRTIFLNISEEIIKHRLELRGEKENIQEKISLGNSEKNFKKYFQYVIENHILSETVESILKIINHPPSKIRL
jgi:guanylate kinase